jgi:hypothetical protein
MSLNEALPYVFATSGLGMACNIDSLLSFHSGILLLLIACLIWIRQLEYRHELNRNAKGRHR